MSVAPLGLQLGVVIGVEFALAALVCAFRRTGAAGPDQPGPGAVDDRHADVAVVPYLDGGGEPGCRWSSDHAPAVFRATPNTRGRSRYRQFKGGYASTRKAASDTSRRTIGQTEVLDDYFEAAGLDEAPLFQSVGPAGRRMKAQTGAPDTPVRPCGRGPAGEAERLHGAWNETGDEEPVLPIVRGKALDAATISKLVRDRASRRCRTASALVPRQAAERTDHPREVVEAACARSDVPRRRARTVFPLRR